MRSAFPMFALLCMLGGAITACSSAHTTQAVPALPANDTIAHRHARANAAGTDVVALNAGGGATGSFAADQDYSASTWTYTTTKTIATGAVTNPAPMAVYQSEREGSTITYTIPGLTANAAYTVRLGFAEIWWTSAGQRVFNVTVNGTRVLTNFDIFAAAGGANTAIEESFNATASASGTITITLAAVKDNAAISAVEIATPGTSATPTPTPTATPTAAPTAAPGTLAIDAGGAAAGTFVADEDYSTGSLTSKVTATISTTGVASPAPQAVYQTQRYGSTFNYTIPGFTARAPYQVRLDFAETYWPYAGKRLFNVSINGVGVLSNFDIFKTAGGMDRAVAETFSTTATSTGTIVISFTTNVDNASINGIEISAASATPTPTPTATPTAAPTTGFNDYATFGYDNERDVFNPNTTAITTAAVNNGSIHLAWQSALGGGDYNTQTQPVLATEVPGHAGLLFVGGGSGNVYAYDALSGALVWTRATGQETYTCENSSTIYFGIGGSAAYDPATKSIYVVGNANATPNALASNTLYHLDAATGAVLGQVNFAPALAGWKSLDFSHTSVTLGGNGLAYVGTGATCDISSWRGRVAAINVPAMTLANTYYPAWNGTTQPWGGAGIWGWGGVALDFSGNVITGVGNTDNGATTHGSIVAPFAAAPTEYSGNGEALIALSPDLSTLEASNHPIPTSAYTGSSVDLDLQGTPAIVRPTGSACDPIAAVQGKSGSLYLYDTTRIGAGPIGQFALAPSSYQDSFLGGPAFSGATGLLYAAVPSSSGSLFPPGMVAINPGCGTPSVAWHSAFGPDSGSAGVPRSVPAASAGGVVFVGTPCSPTTNGGCAGSATVPVTIITQSTRRKPQICCAPPGPGDGALWALDASTGTVLNGGQPLIYTSGPLRVPPTIDGNWIFVLDNNGDLYGLTIDPKYPAIAAKARSINPRMMRRWQSAPTAP